MMRSFLILALSLNFFLCRSVTGSEQKTAKTEIAKFFVSSTHTFPSLATIIDSYLPVPFDNVFVSGQEICGLKADASMVCATFTYLTSETIKLPQLQHYAPRAYSQRFSSRYYSCGLTPGGKITCDEDKSRPFSFKGTYSQFSLAHEHVCTIEKAAGKKDGPVKCLLERRPMRVASGNFVKVAAGQTQDCAIKENGEVTCWNVYQQQRPMRVLEQKYADIAGGGVHHCGLHSDGKVSCWFDWSKAIDGATMNAITAPNRHFSQIATGDDISCGMSGEKILCWGDFYSNRHSDNKPFTQIPGSYTKVAAGGSIVCGLTFEKSIRCRISHDANFVVDFELTPENEFLILPTMDAN